MIVGDEIIAVSLNHTKSLSKYDEFIGKKGKITYMYENIYYAQVEFNERLNSSFEWNFHYDDIKLYDSQREQMIEIENEL